MNFLKTIGAVSAIGAALAIVQISGVTTANAMPNISNQSAIGANNTTALHMLVRNDRRWGNRKYSSRRGYRNRHRRHYDNDFNPGAFIALGVLGALVTQGMSEGNARSAMQRCDNRFRSFEWDTGYYTTYDGDKVLCPYLR
jgi:hypothetical protein